MYEDFDGDMTELVGDYKLNEKPTMQTQEYSFAKSFGKTVIRVCVLLIPIAMTWLPAEWMNITLGGVLMMIFDWLKAKYASV